MGRVLLLGELSPVLPPLEINVNRAVISSRLSKDLSLCARVIPYDFPEKNG